MYSLFNMEKISLSSSHKKEELRDDNNNADARTGTECQIVQQIEKDMTNEDESQFNEFKSILSSSTGGEWNGDDDTHVFSISEDGYSSLQQSSISIISLPYRVAHCQEELGRYLVAARDLEEGEIILDKELPITSGPERDSPLICPGCYEEPHQSHTCVNCGWPLCGPKCPGINRHHMECSLLTERRNSHCRSKESDNDSNHKLHKAVEKSINFWKTMSDNLMIIRCLALKYFDPSKFKRLLQMETNYEQWSRSPLFERAKETIQILLQQTDGIVDEEKFTVNEMLTIQAVLDINAYEGYGRSGRANLNQW